MIRQGCLAVGLLLAGAPMAAQAQMPNVVSPPLSKFAIVGQSVTFSATLGSAAGASYEWRHHGRVVASGAAPGSTLSFPIVAASETDRGWYQLVVTNASGSTTTTFALDVVPEHGALRAWGDDYNSQSSVPAGVGRVATVAAGRGTWVLRTDGSVVNITNLNGVLSANAVALAHHSAVLAVNADGTLTGGGDNFYGHSTIPPGLTQVVGAATGFGFSLALRANGTVVAWGLSTSNQTVIPAGLNNVVQLAAGAAHALAVRGDGTVVAWGSNSGGQCDVPAGLATVVAIAAGNTHSLALRADGTVVLWGTSTGGAATVPAGLSGVRRISSGGEHALALKSDGEIVAWGLNYPDAVGSVPALLELHGVVGLSAGLAHNVAIIPAEAPMILVPPESRVLAAGATFRLGVAASGTPPLSYVWRRDGVDLAANPRNVPYLVLSNFQTANAGSYTVEISNAAGTVVSPAAALSVGAPPTIAQRPLSRIVSVGQSADFTVAATGTAPLTYHWRRNGRVLAGETRATLNLASAQLSDRGTYDILVEAGNGATARSVFQLEVTPLPVVAARAIAWGNGSTALIAVPVSLLEPVALAAGKPGTAAVQADGRVRLWGDNYFGNNDVSGITDAVGAAVGETHVLVLKADGTVAGTGYGQIGESSVPQGLTDVVAIGADFYHSAALRADGTLVEWGSSYSLVIPDLSSVSNVVSFATGSAGLLAIQADGTVVRRRGALAVPLPAGLANVTAAAVGDQHFLALKADGTVVGWGTGVAASVPAGLGNVVQIAAGGKHSVVVKADGTLVTWGDDARGQSTIPFNATQVISADGGAHHSAALIRANGPALTTLPTSQTVTAGGTVTLRVVAVGSGTLTYLWRKDGVALTDGGKTSGATSPTLTVTGATAADAGGYTVLVTDATGSMGAGLVVVTVLTATAPTNDNFANATLLNGNNGSITGNNVAATGEPGEPAHAAGNPASAVSSVWYAWTPSVSGVATLRAPQSDFATAIAIYTGTAVNNLTLYNRGAFDLPVRAGTRYLVAVASEGSARGSIALNWTLTAAPTNDDFSAAQILGGTSGSVTGSNVSATAEPDEIGIFYDAPVPATRGSSVWFRWTPLQSGTAIFGTQSTEFHNQFALYTGSAVWALTRLGRDWGTMPSITQRVVAGTPYHIAVSSYFDNRGTFTLNWRLLRTPAITTPPQDQALAPGSAATFTVIATGGDLSFQWFKDGQAIPDAIGSTLRIASVQLSDVGRYHVRVTNLDGTVDSSVVTLGGVGPAPTIVTHPSSATALAGQPATLAVTATGSGPLSYQWRRDGVFIAGATAASHTLSPASRGDAGEYDVLVASGLAFATSATARLQVEPSVYPGLQQLQPAAWQPEAAESAAVWSVKVLPDGRFYLGGDFDSIDGRPRSRVARFNADGTLDATFVPPTVGGSVRIVVPLADGSVLIAGGFQQVGMEARSGLAKLDATGALDHGFVPPAFSGSIFALAALPDGRLMVGGSIALGSLRRNLYRLEGDGSNDPSFTLGTDEIRAFAVFPDGRVLVGGSFSAIFPGNNAPSIARRGLVRLAVDGSVDATFDPGAAYASGGVGDLALLADGKLYALTDYTLANGTRLGRVSRFNADGTLDAAYSLPYATFSESVNSMTVAPDTKVYISASTMSLARLNADGTFDLGFPRRQDGAGYRIAVQPDGRLVAGMQPGFSGFGVTVQRLTAEGTIDPSVTASPRRAGEVSAILQLPGGKTLLGGSFDYFGGVAAPGLVRLKADGTVDASFRPNLARATYRGLLLQGDKIVVVGSFSTTEGANHLPSVLRLNSDGTRDMDFAPPYNAYLDISIAPSVATLPDGRLAIAHDGGTTWGGGGATRGLLVLLGNGQRDPGVQLAAGILPNQVRALAAQRDGKVLLVGAFTSANGVARNRVTRLNPDGTNDATFDPGMGANDTVEAVAVLADGRIVLGGRFTMFDGLPARYAARLLADGSLDRTFLAASADGFVLGLLPQEDGRLILRGEFTHMDDTFATHYLARLNVDGTLDRTFLVGPQPAPGAALVLTDNGELLAPSPLTVVTTTTNEPVASSVVRYAPAFAPTIVSGPADQPVDAGQRATFAVTVAGTPRIDAQWSFNGLPIPGATGRSYVIPSAQQDDVGTYAIALTSPYGTVTKSAQLRGVNPLPVIVTAPQAASLAVGAELRLSVTATTVGPVRYQWRRNGIQIPGATGPAYHAGATTLAHDGVYEVVINDGLAQTISDPVRVMVSPPRYPDLIGADESFAPAFEVARGYVGGSLRLPAGQRLVFGTFTRFDGVVTRNLARLRSDGAVDLSFTPAPTNGTIYAAAVQADGRILIGGAFTEAGGLACGGVARLNANGTVDPTFVPATRYSVVFALAVQGDGRIVLGGRFPGGLARLNADGSVDASFRGATNAAVNALLAQADGRIVVGGAFTAVNGTVRNRLARLAADGTLDPQFGIGTLLNGEVNALRPLIDGRYLVGGAFTASNSNTCGRIVRLTETGANDPTWGTGSGFGSGAVYSLDVQPDGRILVGGSFLTFDGALRSRIARLQADGALDSGFRVPGITQGSGAIGVLAVFAVHAFEDGTAFLGGSFGAVNSVARVGIARVNATGEAVEADLSGGVMTPARVNRLAPAPGGRVFAAGTFTHVNGEAQRGLARLNADGSLDTSFPESGTGPNDNVHDVHAQMDGRLVVGGLFTTYHEQAQGRLTRLMADGRLDPTWAGGTGVSNFTDRVLPTPSNGVLVFGTSIFSYNGVTRSGLIATDGNGTLDDRMKPAFSSGAVLAAGYHRDGRLVAGGSFTRVDGLTRNRLVRVLRHGVVDPGFNVDVNGTVQALVVQSDEKILIAGDFLLVNNTPHARIARLNADGSVDATFAPDFAVNAGVSSLALQPDGRILVVGGFDVVTNFPAARYVIRLAANGVLDRSFAVPGLSAAPTDLLLRDDGSLLLAGGDLRIGGTYRAGLVRSAPRSGPAGAISGEIVALSNANWGSRSSAFDVAASAVPVITQQPRSASGQVGENVTLAVAAIGADWYHWRRDGTTLPFSSSPTLTLTNVQLSDAGAYSVLVGTSAGASVLSQPAVVGVLSAVKLAGSASEVGTDIRHPNGNVYDQVLLTGTTATITTDPNQVTRLSYIDLTDDIVQVEFGGSGSLQITLENATGPARPRKYIQAVDYMKGHASLVITGADATTNVTVFTVGRATAVNQALFRDDVTYDGFSDIATISISSRDGKFGGLRTANASYFNTRGLTGLFAPGVEFTGPVWISDIDALEVATPTLVFESATDVRITGGSLLQDNAAAIEVGSIFNLSFTDGTSSHGTLLPGQSNRGRFVRDGVDVTSQLVGPSP